jgi:hypothetical protein
MMMMGAVSPTTILTVDTIMMTNIITVIVAKIIITVAMPPVTVVTI